MSEFAGTPGPPYVAVIFTSRIRVDAEGYHAMSRRMADRVEGRPGFLGMESMRDAQGFGVTVSYWRDLDAVRAWRDDPAHTEARTLGRDRWYAGYRVRVCEVQREYGFDTDRG